jgi:tetratricopeptide (TPR) repeat protein
MTNRGSRAGRSGTWDTSRNGLDAARPPTLPDNSPPACRGPGRLPTHDQRLECKRVHRCRVLPLLILSVGLTFAGNASEDSPAEQARARFQEAEKAYSLHPKDAEAVWKFGRACFDLGEFSTTREQRAEVAQKGIDACRQAVTQEPNSAPLHYYLGLNLGQLARTRSLGALKLVEQMEPQLTQAAALDPHFDYAGPDRSLGLLYRDAPTLISIGNRGKAREHLRRAVELAPDYPENRLDLIESYLKWGDRTGARQELAALEKSWPKAHEKFKGPAWTASWADWDAQLKTLKSKSEESSKLESPRH